MSAAGPPPRWRALGPLGALTALGIVFALIDNQPTEGIRWVGIALIVTSLVLSLAMLAWPRRTP